MKVYNPLCAFWQSSALYPLKGFVYFVSHPAFWPLFRTRLIPIVFLSAFILATLFIWTYLPQVAFLSILHGPGAFVNAAFLVLGESAAIIAILFEIFFVDETLLDVFDAVLINEGLSDLVGSARILDPTATDSVKMLGKPTKSAVYSPFSFRQTIEFIIFLPLNFIPIVGVPVFLFLTGYRAGPFHHWRYFQLIGLSKKERKAYIKQRKLRYTWFGTMALVLQLIPVLSMFFLLTTAAGSALWAVKIEKARIARQSQEIDPTEAYEDDPV